MRPSRAIVLPLSKNRRTFERLFKHLRDIFALFSVEILELSWLICLVTPSMKRGEFAVIAGPQALTLSFHREIKVFGQDITDEHSVFAFADLADVPESKSNNVSFMKVEDLDVNCRNLLLTSDSYVCYSVTQKKNLLRVIDTITGEKTILRGHEGAILDLHLSPVDHNSFCSVDNTSSGAGPHSIIWKKAAEGFAFNPVASFALRASCVVAHPLLPYIWCAAEKSELAVFSSNKGSSNQTASMDQVGLHYKFDTGVITGVCFTPDGNHLLVSVQVSEGQSYLQVLRLGPCWGPEASLTDHQYSTITPVLADYRALLKMDNIVSMTALAKVAVIVSQTDSIEGAGQGQEVICYEIKVFDYSAIIAGGTTTPKMVQSILLSLPLHRSKLSTASSSLKNRDLEVALSVEPKKGRYMVLTSRRSPYLAVLGLLPADADASVASIFHVTLLNLRAPIISHSISTILGREHHSYVEDEYMEISAYQEEAAEQASIQQYHIHIQYLFNLASFLANTSRSNSVESIVRPRTPENGTILGLLKSMNSMSTPVADLMDHAPPADSTPINNTSTSAMKPIGSKGKLVDEESSSILLSLRKSSSNSSVVLASPKDIEAASEGAVKMKKVDSSKLFGAPAVSSPAAGSADDELPAFLNTSVNKSTPILQMIRPKTGTAVPVPAVSTPVAAPVPEPAVPAAPVVAHAPAVVKPIATKATAKVAPTPVHAPAHAPAPLTVQTSLDMAGVAESLTALTGTQAAFVDRLHTTLDGVLKSHSELSPMSAANSLVLKEEMVKEMAKLQTKSNQQLSAFVKTVLEAENKKIADMMTAHKQEMAAQLQEALVAQIPVLSNKLRDAAKDSVKQSLSQSFRTAFESSLLPAFQAGTERMFAQLSAGFEEGMRNVSTDCQQLINNQQAAYNSLQQEVGELKDSVRNMEALLQQLVAGGGVGKAAPAPAQQQSPVDLIREVLPTPFVLLGSCAYSCVPAG